MEQRLLLSLPFHIWGLLGLANLSMVPQITLWKWQGKVPAPGNCLQSPMKKWHQCRSRKEMRFQLAEVAEVQRPKSLLSGSDAGQPPRRASWRYFPRCPIAFLHSHFPVVQKHDSGLVFSTSVSTHCSEPSLSTPHTSSSASGVSPILSLMCRSPLWCSLCHLICLCLLPLHFSRTAWKDSTASFPTTSTASTPCLHFIPLPSEFQLFFCLPGSPELLDSSRCAFISRVSTA